MKIYRPHIERSIQSFTVLGKAVIQLAIDRGSTDRAPREGFCDFRVGLRTLEHGAWSMDYEP